MTHKLELRNVTHYSADANPAHAGPKYYGIEVQKPGVNGTAELILRNRAINLVEGEENEVADRTFDCKFNYIGENACAKKRIFEIQGLKVDRGVEYDDENHVFTATMDDNQESEWLLEYDNCLNSLMNDRLDLFI
ncbi:hypothetical protein H9I48_04930 [Wolbachia pipientis]|uniref:hypothetical protein n=1 Tax=Wolbachia pipientis TaxID=955 RepID=UPI001651587A|nr:hypothetical protein [Wolbachia pipientis]MBC6686544.1 hypothetical protein [Wolbachia pipientis]